MLIAFLVFMYFFMAAFIGLVCYENMEYDQPVAALIGLFWIVVLPAVVLLFPIVSLYLMLFDKL